MFLFLLCNLINKRYIQISIAICVIHQFHLQLISVFTSCSSSFAHWRFVFSKICMGCLFHVLLGRTFVFGLRIKKTLKTKKTFKTKNLKP